MKTLGCGGLLLVVAMGSFLGCQTQERLTDEIIDISSSSAKSGSIVDSQLKHLVEQAEKYPRRSDIHFKISTLHLNQREDLRAAMDALEDALRIDPKNVQYLYRKGRLHMRMGEYEEAIDSFYSAVDASGKRRYSGLHSALGYALALQERYDEAKAQFEICIRVDPSESLPYYFLGSIADLHDDREQAIRYLREYLERGGRHFRGRAIEVLKYNGVTVELASKTFQEAQKEGIGTSSVRVPQTPTPRLPAIPGRFEPTPATGQAANGDGAPEPQDPTSESSQDESR